MTGKRWVRRGWLLTVAAILLGLSVFSAHAAGAAAREAPQGLFERNCGTCHGPDGKGGIAPSLEAAAFANIVEPKIREGGQGMPAFVDAPGARRIPVIVDYVVNHIATPEARLATVPEGGQLYRLYCSGCHGATARGGALSTGRNAPSLADTPAANALAAMIRGPKNMPVFAGAALNVRQQAAVSRYVNVLKEPPSPGGNGLGYLGPVTEGALGIILGLGLIVLISIWLGWRKEGDSVE
jgi:ubiquinol-cytochrome c reductase cytochrome c subunit